MLSVQALVAERARKPWKWTCCTKAAKGRVPADEGCRIAKGGRVSQFRRAGAGNADEKNLFHETGVVLCLQLTW
jgi:hypothetical protein